MKKLIVLLLLFSSFLLAQDDYSGSYFTKKYWRLSGTTLSPISSTWSLSGITNITYTGQILAPDGTNSSPSYALSTETNTGFYKYASGQIAFSSAGTARVLFTSSAVQIFNDAGGLFLGTSSDVALRREAADVLALRRSTNHQSFRIYDEDGTTSDRYTRNAWTTDSLYVIQQVISGSKTSRGMLFDDFASYTFDNTLLPVTTNAVSLGSTDFIWSTGVSGTWTLGDDSDNVSGQLNFIASDNDQANIVITTSDEIKFNGASGGYFFMDGKVEAPSASGYGWGSGDNLITSFSYGLRFWFYDGVSASVLKHYFNNAGEILVNSTTDLGAYNIQVTGAGIFRAGTGGSATDSSFQITYSSGSPVANFFGTDGDTWNIGINTDDGALFSGATTYTFDNNLTVTSADPKLYITNTGAVASGYFYTSGNYLGLKRLSDNAIMWRQDLPSNIFSTGGAAQFGSNVTIGEGTAGVDYTITVNGEDNDGVITYDEDNDKWIFSEGLYPTAAGSLPLGSTTYYWSNVVSSDFTIGSGSGLFGGDGSNIKMYSTSGVINVKYGAVAQNFRIYDEDLSGDNDRYANVGWLADSSYVIDQYYSGSKVQRPFALTDFSAYTIDNNLTIGEGTAGVDYTITVNGEDNDGVITYDEDNDSFGFDNDVSVGGDLTVTGNLLVTGSETYYAEMYFNNNSSAQTPTANDTTGIIYFTQGDLNGFTFDAGSSGSYTEVADGGGGTIAILDAEHGLSVGDWIMITNSSVAGYEGVHVVTYVATDTFKVAVAYSATATGDWQEPSRVTLTQAGLTNAKFKVDWNISGSVAGSPAGDAVVWGFYVNEIPKVEAHQIRTLSTGGVYGSFGSGAIINMSTNDDLFMFFVSDDTNALTHKYGSVRLLKL